MWNRIRPVLVVALAGLALLDLGVRLIGPRLDDPLPYGLAPPLEWLEPDYQRIVLEMDEVARTGGDTGLVLVGTSMVMFDLRADLLEAMLPSIGPVRNAAAPDATAAITRRWLLEEVVPRLHPSRVVWGVSSLDFNSSRHRLDAYESTRPGGVGFIAEVDRVLGTVSAISRYRELLRRPGPLLDVRRPREPFQFPERLVDSSPVGAVSKGDAQYRQLVGFLSEFQVSGVELRAIADTSAALRSQGIELVLLLMPVPSEYVAAHLEGRSEFDEWRAWVASEAGRLGIPVIDHSALLPDSAFPDFTHLGADGAVELTEAVVDDLTELGW